MNVHLAQINIGRLRAPLDDPKIAGFVAQLDPINALADAAPGFVWRLQSASGNATELAYNDDPEGRERLEHYQHARAHAVLLLVLQALSRSRARGRTSLIIFAAI